MRQFLMIIVLTFSTSLFACGGSDKSADSNPPTAPSTETSETSG